MLKDRQKLILESVVRFYIKTARPVASRDLLKERTIDASPATIRNDMLELVELGYLEQPHISAGRIPTDQGYRFFVDHLPDNPELSAEEKDTLASVFGIRDEDEFLQKFGRVLSHTSRTLSAVGILEEDRFYETGFSEILEEPEFDDFEQVKLFGQLADALDHEVRSFLKTCDDPTEQVFIGGENPWKCGKSSATIISTWHHPRGFSGYLTLVGPRRTNYLKHKALVECIQTIT